MSPKFTPEIITAAIEGFESQKRLLDVQIAELRQMLNGTLSEPGAVSAPTPKRRKRSAAVRARMAEAQRKRWANSKKAAPASEPPTPKRRKLSAAGKKRIIAATKARWARARAEKQQTLALAKPKKSAVKKATKASSKAA